VRALSDAAEGGEGTQRTRTSCQKRRKTEKGRGKTGEKPTEHPIGAKTCLGSFTAADKPREKKRKGERN